VDLLPPSPTGERINGVGVLLEQTTSPVLMPVDRATLAFVPPVVFYFPDRTRGVSENGAALLVAHLGQRPEASPAAASLAERIATESGRGTFDAPGQDLELSHDEQRELLATLKGTAESWPEEDRASLHELQLALAAQTSRPEQTDT
jgi:hypothetical protein